jgi:hypothetical protein
MKQLVFAAIALCISPAGFAQTKTIRSAAPSSATRDQLGMTCAQILELSSTAWVSQFDAKANDAASPPKTVRALVAYGRCYDARTDRLAASLAKTAAASTPAARKNLSNLLQSLDAFTSKALAAGNPPADALKSAYAQLYEKQFRYEFYQSYEKPPAKSPAGPAAKTSTGVATAAAANSSAVPPSATSAANATASNAPGDANPVSMAKNHFGELLDALPEDKEHELHAAFGEIIGRSQITEAMRLEIYRYAIFLLEPPSATPFSPPPF